MKLFECIDGLLAGTRYLAWVIGLVGIVGSIVLFVVNLSTGIASAAVFIAAFFLAVGVTLLLLPKKLVKGKLESNKRFVAGALALMIAAVLMGIIYFTNGGSPSLNLIFA